jgi:hypothetical protein
MSDDVDRDSEDFDIFNEQNFYETFGTTQDNLCSILKKKNVNFDLDIHYIAKEIYFYQVEHSDYYMSKSSSRKVATAFKKRYETEKKIGYFEHNGEKFVKVPAKYREIINSIAREFVDKKYNSIQIADFFKTQLRSRFDDHIDNEMFRSIAVKIMEYVSVIKKQREQRTQNFERERRLKEEQERLERRINNEINQMEGYIGYCLQLKNMKKNIETFLKNGSHYIGKNKTESDIYGAKTMHQWYDIYIEKWSVHSVENPGYTKKQEYDTFRRITSKGKNEDYG